MNTNKIDDLQESFKSPPKGYGIVPFYWWVGDPLTKERIRWQLDKMKNHSISGLQINYAHSCEGGISFGLTYESEPALFSEDWWELFGWLLNEGKQDGFSTSLSDYTLGCAGQGFYADEIRNEYPQMRGQLLESYTVSVKSGESVNIKLPADYITVCAIYDNQTVNLNDIVEANELKLISSQACEIMVISAKLQEYSLDPMHPEIGNQVCEKFFGRFENHFPDEGGRGLNFFFSDELNFGISGKLWNIYFQDEFYKRKGYDITSYLPCLFSDVGKNPAKVRLDYYDVIVQLEEENYFQKVFSWHESRGMTYGCDHGGRGYDVIEFGDYMRTQKYNQGPGCDQPKLSSDIIKNKVASSIAHLYGRERVWLEGFYGSGWGTTSADLADAIARNFTMGHNLLSLHGMYYTTHGGWWEWAPPCNCFRMPYWDDLKELTKAVERMSYLLSRGVHHCDCAVLYPVAAKEGGFDGDASIKAAFTIAENLYKKGIDLDFIDHESILRADIDGKLLKVSGEAYKIIIVPSMKTVRFNMLQKLLDFKNQGGTVLYADSLPEYSDACNPEQLKEVVSKLFCSDSKVSSAEDISKCILSRIEPDFLAPQQENDVYINHRIINADVDTFMIYGVPKGSKCYFKATGVVSLWNPYDGEIYSVKNCTPNGEGTDVVLPLESHEFQILVFDRSHQFLAKELFDVTATTQPAEIITLSNEWDFTLVPCLDNEFGDFSLPATHECLGAQARILSFCMSDEKSIPEKEKFKKQSIYSYGSYFLQAGTFADEQELQNAVSAALANDLSLFKNYDFSMRYGVWNDPGKQGYHGLKEQVSDDFLTIGQKHESQIGTEYLEENSGFGRVFYTTIYCENDMKANVITGSLKPDSLFVNGQEISNNAVTVMLHRGYNPVIAVYRSAGRTHLLFSQKDEPTNSQNQIPLAMSWYKNQNILPFDCFGEEHPRYSYFNFKSPPALEKIEIMSVCPCKVWVSGVQCDMDYSQMPMQTVVISDVLSSCADVMIQVENTKHVYGGAVFDEPIKLSCGTGRLHSEDWSKISGLQCYSGSAVYAQSIYIPDGKQIARAILSLEQVSSSASVFVNGEFCGTKISPPWNFEVSPFLKSGENIVEIKVSNTLSNHYMTIPTRYRGNTTSGLIGQANIRIY